MERLVPAPQDLQRGVIVEFTGAAGSGKSTLAAHVLAMAHQRGIAAVSRDEILPLYLETGAMARLVRSLAPASAFERTRWRIHLRCEARVLLRRFARRHPRGWELFRAELERIRAEDPEEHARIERWVERGIRQFMMARARSSRVDLVLCDEGIAHRSVNLFASARPELDLPRLRRFLGSWALPDLVVQVRDSPERCAERVCSRGVPKRLEGRDDAEIRAFVGASAAVSAEIAEEARRRGLPTLEIHNDRSSAEDLLGSAACGALVDDLLGRARQAPKARAVSRGRAESTRKASDVR